MDAVELGQDSVVVVSSNAALRDALEALSAGMGGTILLDAAGGPYDISASGRGHPTETITIMSADPDDPAVVQRILAVNSRNLTFSDLTVDSSDVYQDRSAHFTDLDVYNSTNITVQNSHFQSAAEGLFDGTGDGYVHGETLGRARESEGFSFVGNTVSNYGWGLMIQESDDTVISGNSFSKIQMDGLRMVGVRNILVEDNSFTDWLGSTFEVNHDDMIQIWSRGAEQVTENVIIRGNLLMAGDVAASQSIFIRNEVHSGDENAFRNIVIEDNTIYNGHNHGISVGGTIGLRIANNTVLYNDRVGYHRDADSAPKSSAPTIRVDSSKDVIVENNIAGGYTLSGNAAINNATVNYTNPAANSFVSKVFVNAASGGSLDLRDLRLLEDSPFVGLGSSAVQPGAMVDGLTPVIRSLDGRAGEIILDASLSVDENGLLSGQEGVRFVWTFADGVQMEGEVVTRAFDSHGPQAVVLEVLMPDGSFGSLTREVTVMDPELLRLTFDDGLSDQSSYATWVGTKGATKTDMLAEGTSGQGLHIGGAAKMIVTRDAQQLKFLNEFSLGADIKLDEAGTSGSLIEQIGSLYIVAKDGGFIRAALLTDDGIFKVEAPAGTLGDAWHRVDLSYDGSTLKLYFDGEMVDETAASGTIKTSKYDLTLGSTWHSSIGASFDNLSMVAQARSAEDVAALHEAMTTALFPPAAQEALLPEPVAEPGNLLHLDFEGEVTDASANNVYTWGRGATKTDMLTDGTSGQGLHIGGAAKLAVSRRDLNLSDATEFTLGADIRLDRAGDTGTLIQQFDTLNVSALGGGSIGVVLVTDQGVFRVQAPAGTLDAAWHRVDLSYDGAVLKLYFDGTMVDQTPASGTVNAGKSDLTLGSVWHSSIGASFDNLSINDRALAAEEILTRDAAMDWALSADTFVFEAFDDAVIDDVMAFPAHAETVGPAPVDAPVVDSFDLVMEIIENPEDGYQLA